MPGGDRTGPMGMGPMTGWGRGFCARSVGSSWFGRGIRGERGWRNQFYATGLTGWQRSYPISQKEESEILKEQAEYLSSELESIRSRLNELEQNQGK